MGFALVKALTINSCLPSAFYGRQLLLQFSVGHSHTHSLFPVEDCSYPCLLLPLHCKSFSHRMEVDCAFSRPDIN